MAKKQSDGMKASDFSKLVKKAAVAPQTALSDKVGAAGPCPVATIFPCPDNPRTKSKGETAYIRKLRRSMESEGWKGEPISLVPIDKMPGLREHYSIPQQCSHMILSGHMRFGAWTGEGCGLDPADKKAWAEPPVKGEALGTHIPGVEVMFGSLEELLGSLAATTVRRAHSALALARLCERKAAAENRGEAERLTKLLGVLPDGEDKKKVVERIKKLTEGAIESVPVRRMATLLQIDRNQVDRMRRILRLSVRLQGLFETLSEGAVIWVEKISENLSDHGISVVADAIEFAMASGAKGDLKKVAMDKMAELLAEGHGKDGSDEALKAAFKQKTEQAVEAFNKTHEVELKGGLGGYTLTLKELQALVEAEIVQVDDSWRITVPAKAIFPDLFPEAPPAEAKPEGDKPEDKDEDEAEGNEAANE